MKNIKPNLKRSLPQIKGNSIGIIGGAGRVTRSLLTRLQERTQDRTKLFHPAIVWDKQTHGDSDFVGIMLTSASPGKGYDNVAMSPEHFSTGFEITYKKSHFVNQKFVKFSNWGAFEKVGKLTTSGIKFIEEKISSAPVIPFDIYTQE